MLYYPGDGELSKARLKARRLTRQINNTTEEEIELREKLLKSLFSSFGKDSYIEPPIRVDYGNNINIGKNFFANFDCIILDVCKVNIGDNVLFGPRVSILTPLHPIHFEARNSALEFGKEVKIGNNVWIGGNVTINGGVTIGDNTIIGSGSVVTNNIESNVIAFGNPCKVYRSITEEDKVYWNNKKEEYYNSIK